MAYLVTYYMRGRCETATECLELIKTLESEGALEMKITDPYDGQLTIADLEWLCEAEAKKLLVKREWAPPGR